MKHPRLIAMILLVACCIGIAAAPAAAQTAAIPGVFTQVSPALNATVTTSRPTFIWNVASGATSYDLYVRRSTGVTAATGRVNASACVNGRCSLTVGTALTNGAYTWTVVAINSSGTRGAGWRAFSVNVTSTPVPTPTPTPVPPSSLAQQMLTLVNQQRCAARLVPLALDTRLNSAAQVHSNRMVQYNFFAHTDPINGTQPWDRMRTAGYPWTTAGENIAAGNATAQATFTQWWNSSGHRANIMNPNFREMGLGYTAGGSYRHYWTQVFGNRSGATGGTCP
ncbi:MAG: CAP domain-containing protein [bacterium]|nr:CAP domain-containing protein [bacterium]